MSMHDLALAFELVAKNASLATFAGPQPASRIRLAQAALGVFFPPTYREFVTRLGCGGLGSTEFYGVATDDFEHSSVPDAIWLTLKNRAGQYVPDSFVVIGSTGDGAYYAIDTARTDANGENPVVEWWPGLSGAVGNPRDIASDFGEFFFSEISDELKEAS